MKHNGPSPMRIGTMILQMFRPPRDSAIIDALYGAIVAQARLPVLYESFGVPDTVAGRFEMVVLHLWMVLRRTGRTPVSERLVERFCRDMDHNLREIGVGDLTVPKQITRMMSALLGRQNAYEEALPGGEPAVEAVVVRNVFSGAAPPQGEAKLLAAYVVRCAAAVASTGEAPLQGGSLVFADPGAILAGLGASGAIRAPS
jgi:cytochrome b pre-mRNA-processing protein 3